MGNKFVQQVAVVTTGLDVVRPHVNLSEVAFFDTAGNPLIMLSTPAAANADVASANATDLPTAITLVNELKAQVNSLQAKLRTAGLLLL